MNRRGSDLLLSATDLSNYLGCAHLTSLDRAAADGELKKPSYPDPSLEVIRQCGLEHEEMVLERYRAEGLEIARPEEPPKTEEGRLWARGAESTVESMRAGADIIYQGTLFDGTWLGRPDFLRRVDRSITLGAWSYEVIDAKLAREAKGGAVLQICLYSDLLARAQGVSPESMHLALGNQEGELESFRVNDYAAYFRSVRRRFLDALADGVDTHPEPVGHCDVCDWHPVCRGRWVEDDHLSLVAGITRRQRQCLEERGTATMEELARLDVPLSPRLESVSDSALTRIRDQARIQVEGRTQGRMLYELFPDVMEGAGLAALPAPSPGDLFFDIEGDPYALRDGLEYLLGYVDARGDYEGLWAFDREGERKQFEAFMDSVFQRMERHPDLHIYHYAPYEPSAVKRLMGRYGTREEEVDRLLRGGVFVDLYRVVRQGLRASVESYSIKKLEPLYGYERRVDLRAASSALANFEAWLELGRKDESGNALLQEIQGYNRDDCLSTLRLRDWLEECRTDLAGDLGVAVPRPAPPDPDPSERAQEEAEQVRVLFEALTGDVPADPEARTPDQHARWILAHLLSFHRREKKSVWWEYFRCLALEGEEYIEDGSTLGGLEYEGVVGTIKRSEIHRYRFPRQDHGIRVRTTPRDPATQGSVGTVVALDEGAGTIDLKRGSNSQVPHPFALIPLEDVNDQVLRDSLLRLAADVVEHGLDGAKNRAALDLLLRSAPRVGQTPGAPLRGVDEDGLDAARRLVLRLQGTVLPVQGPPGSGKTYSGARMISTLLREGRRVGITATGHKVISNLLAEVCKAAESEALAIRGIQKADDEQWCGCPEIVATNGNNRVRDGLASEQATLAAGTPWLWSREEMANSVNVLFVDEAGQMSLANVLAVSQAAHSLVLLGDPRQLEQPRKGVHPAGTDVSALDHLVGETTVASDRGLFLERTWRLHPELCAFTSELYYEGRLQPKSGLEDQRLEGSGTFDGAGLGFFPVEHQGNTTESREEAEAVAALVGELMKPGAAWTDAGTERRKPLELDDILVVAPYNAQVALLRQDLPEGARVGTVDKLQGQEAAVVIFSPASSSAADAPRGMEFLYNPNRLNVATSRARCMAIIVGSPALFSPECRSPRQMRLANGFCRFLEMVG
ncbi:TM0106 family RecB-like putative nuclease [Gemmatimonadota bacterium]